MSTPSNYSLAPTAARNQPGKVPVCA